MRKYLWCGLLFLCVVPVRAEAPPKVVQETWNSVSTSKAFVAATHAPPFSKSSATIPKFTAPLSN